MASQFALTPRVEALQASGLVVTGEYRGTPPLWLVTVFDDCDVHLINVKGCKVDDTPVMIRLSKLEQLLGGTNGK